jgi:hypothetical protein
MSTPVPAKRHSKKTIKMAKNKASTCFYLEEVLYFIWPCGPVKLSLGAGGPQGYLTDQQGLPFWN